MLTMEQFENRKKDSVGSSRIRGSWMMKYCPEITPFKLGKHYDVMIYQKAYWDDHMRAFDGIKIFDICDPDWLDGRPITEVADLCDAFTVPTQRLHDFLVQITDKPVVVIPDRIDPDVHFPIKQHHLGKLRTVVWFGYGQNQSVLEPVVNALEGYGIQLVVISDRSYPRASVNIKYNYQTIYEDLVKYDAVLLPNIGQDNFRFSFKSNNKTLTSWAIGMPVIAELDDLERFADPEERRKESDKRLMEVVDKWHVKESGKQYLDLIDKISTLKKREGVTSKNG